MATSAGAQHEAHLVLAVVQARAAWPTVAVAEARFRAYLEERLGVDDGEPGPPEDALARLHVGYLYLCCACADGDPRALELFDQRFLRTLAPVLARGGADEDQAGDVIQRLRKQLFAAEDGRLPGITGYSGRGDLRGWLRVTAVRELVRIRVAAGKNEPLDTGEVARIAAVDSDPELGYLKRAYGNEFSRAFADALADLDPRQRALLRHQIVEHLSIDDIGVLYQVHRATAARWLVDARAALAETTRSLLAARLRIGTTELDSIMRMIASQLDVSVGGLLQGEG